MTKIELVSKPQAAEGLEGLSAGPEGLDASQAQAAPCPLLRIDDIHKSFGENHVLRGISLSVEKGEVIAIIGASGGGKSTLLRCATLLETMDSGLLAYDDLVVCRNDASGHAVYASKRAQQDARLKFGLVFQNFNLFPHYSVLKNITEGPLLVQKRDKEEVMARPRPLSTRWGSRAKRTRCPATSPAASSSGWP